MTTYFEVCESRIQELQDSRRIWRTIAVVSLLLAILTLVMQPHLHCYEDGSCQLITILSEGYPP